jgi:hypothetical protein
MKRKNAAKSPVTENHPLFQQQRAKLERAVHHAWQVGGAEQRRKIVEL